ncbi:MAG: metal-dependent transcriptional regulator [Candidatus Asgardarchaeum californiense]|nr:MAG: metal-dependent transcriptional regulator [Candidatus Asgardarchaeum californiense]
MRKKTIEDYVELVYILQEKNNKVHTTDVASALNINPASVTEIFQKLSSEGYINYERYGGASLTKKGKKIAIATKKKHDMLKEFFLILGVDEKVADGDACRIEHVMDSKTVDRLTRFVEFVHREKEGPRWLDHFKYFYETGNYVECNPSNEKNCPVHGKK